MNSTRNRPGIAMSGRGARWRSAATKSSASMTNTTREGTSVAYASRSTPDSNSFQEPRISLASSARTVSRVASGFKVNMASTFNVIFRKQDSVRALPAYCLMLCEEICSNSGRIGYTSIETVPECAMSRALADRFNCPTEFALTVLGGKWKTIIIAYLSERPCHYGELRQLLPGLSDKVLSERLKDLQRSGLVTRCKSDASNSRRPSYVLTSRGATR